MRFVLASVLICLAATAQAADRLSVEVANALLSNSPSISPVVTDETTNEQLKASQAANSRWLYDVNLKSNDLVRRFEITLHGLQDHGVLVPPVTIANPFYFDGTLGVTIEAQPNVDIGASTVMQLYATNITNLNARELVSFNAKARAVALARIKRLGDDVRQVYTYDVEAVFKFLESAVRMDRDLYVLPDSSVLDANQWMKNVTDNAPDVVNASIGMPNAGGVVKNIENLEPLSFNALWENIKTESCPEQLGHMRTYQEMYLSVPNGIRRAQIDEVTHVPYALILSSIAHCVAEDAKAVAKTGSGEDRARAAAALNSVLSSIDKQVLTSDAPSSAMKLIASDKIVLENLKKHLKLPSE